MYVVTEDSPVRNRFPVGTPYVFAWDGTWCLPGARPGFADGNTLIVVHGSPGGVQSAPPTRVSSIHVTAPASETVVVGKAVTVPVTATDSDSAHGVVLTFTATGLPPGLNIDPQTGTISGVPTEDGGSTSVITATDSNGSSDNRTQTVWTVVPPETKHVSTRLSATARPGTVTVGHLVTLSVRLVGSDVPQGRNQLRLDARQAGSSSWQVANKSIRTNSKGLARVTVRPKLTTRYRWTYLAASGGTPAMSTPVTVRVRQRVTLHAPKRTARAGQQVTLTMTVTPAVDSGQRAVLYIRQHGKLAKTTTAVTVTAKTTAVPFQLGSHARHVTVRVRLAAGSGYAASWSPSAELLVRT